MFRGEAFYAGFQEFGTKHHEANPFLLPALSLVEGSLHGLYSKAVREFIEAEKEEFLDEGKKRFFYVLVWSELGNRNDFFFVFYC